ncbi:MAG: extracellular solute-binding protein [Spirochaetales bacterium]|nr:extracellular solute-binding protein [Spirochaetales bacterium]
MIKLNRHPYSDAIIKRLPLFEELTGIDVEYTVVNESLYYEDLETSLGEKRKPDVFMTGAYHLWSYAAESVIEPVDSYIDSTGLTDPDYNFEDFYGNIIDSLRWMPGNPELGSGPLLALPLGFELYSLAYNKRIFNEMGLEPPDTYDELLELCRKLNYFDGPGSYAIALRGTDDWSAIHTSYLTTYTNFGARDFETDGTAIRAALDSPESVRMNSYWRELVRSGANPFRETQDWYEVGFALGDGRVAMMYDADIISYIQNTPGYTREAGNIAWVPPPVLNKGDISRSNLWIWSLSMSSGSRNKKGAWLFIQYFTGRDFQLWSAVEESNLNPPRQSVFEDPVLQSILTLAEGYTETFNALMPYAGIQFTPHKNIMEISSLWSESVQSLILNPDSSITYELKDLSQRLDSLEGP